MHLVKEKACLVAKLQAIEQVLGLLLLHLGIRVCEGGLDRPWAL